MNKGRRGFFSGAGKTAVMGGAALLLPRSAMSTLSRSSELRKVTEEVYVEESHEISAEQVAALMARVKELETFIANPPWFQGKQGPVGMDGRDGRDGRDHSHEIAELRTMLVNQPVNALSSVSHLRWQAGAWNQPNTLVVDYADGACQHIPLDISTSHLNPSLVCEQLDRIWQTLEYLVGTSPSSVPDIPLQYSLIETHYGY